jgi:hypothetical protein
METDRAKEILKALADGRDPVTGEQFPLNSPYQQADVVRALFLALESLNPTSKSKEPRPVDPNKPKVGTGWTPEEEQQLREAFAANKPIKEIAAAHGRNTGAITSRLEKLGLIDNPHRTGFAAQQRSPAGAAPRPQAPAPARAVHDDAGDCPF